MALYILQPGCSTKSVETQAAGSVFLNYLVSGLYGLDRRQARIAQLLTSRPKPSLRALLCKHAIDRAPFLSALPALVLLCPGIALLF